VGDECPRRLLTVITSIPTSIHLLVVQDDDLGILVGDLRRGLGGGHISDQLLVGYTILEGRREKPVSVADGMGREATPAQGNRPRLTGSSKLPMNHILSAPTIPLTWGDCPDGSASGDC